MVLEDIFTSDLVSLCKSYVVTLTSSIQSCYGYGDRGERFRQGLRREEMGWHYPMGTRAQSGVMGTFGCYVSIAIAVYSVTAYYDRNLMCSILYCVRYMEVAFSNDLFYYLHVHLFGEGCPQGTEEVSDPLDLELQAVVSHSVYIL